MAEIGSETVGDRIRRLRLSAGLSQAQLAGADLSASYVSLIESGRRAPGAEVVSTLARRLSCDESLLTEGRPSERRQRIELELAYAKLVRRHGEADSALERLTRLRAEGGLDPATLDELEFELAGVHETLGDLDAAVDLLVPLFDRAIRGVSALPVTRTGIKLCRCFLDAGDARAAVRFGEQALAAAGARGLEATEENLRLAATVMYAQFQDGELLASAARARQLVALAEGSAEPGGQAALLWNAALVAEARGRLDEAVTLSRKALAMLSEQGSVRDLPRLQYTVAGLLLSADPAEVGTAVALLDSALPALRDLGSAVDLGNWEIERTRAELLLGRPEEAELLARQAIDHLEGHPIPETARAHILLGDCLAVQGHSDQAVAEYLRAGEVLRTMPGSRHLAALWRDLADRHADNHAADTALDAYRRALDLAGVRAGMPLTGAVHDRSAVPPTALSRVPRRSIDAV